MKKAHFTPALLALSVLVGARQCLQFHADQHQLAGSNTHRLSGSAK